MTEVDRVAPEKECPTCEGQGRFQMSGGGPIWDCPACHGTGKAPMTDRVAPEELVAGQEVAAAVAALCECEMVGSPLTADEARILGWLMSHQASELERLRRFARHKGSCALLRKNAPLVCDCGFDRSLSNSTKEGTDD